MHKYKVAEENRKQDSCTFKHGIEAGNRQETLDDLSVGLGPNQNSNKRNIFYSYDCVLGDNMIKPNIVLLL